MPLVMTSTRHMRARELKGEERQLSSPLASRRIHGGSYRAAPRQIPVIMLEPLATA
jgi:hypothetical protein